MVAGGSSSRAPSAVVLDQLRVVLGELDAVLGGAGPRPRC
jgi:hypothetical protein